jgi:SAM-dependent methyltransferase/uncharacterized protein YbaR (Trm112 family)
MNESLLNVLACPRDNESLLFANDRLKCGKGHEYPIVDGVPVMLRDDVDQTIGLAKTSLELATKQIEDDARAPGYFVASLGINDDEKAGVVELVRTGSQVDPVVSYLVGATNGILYADLIGALQSYPIPDIPLPDESGKHLLDIGCSWGRWSIAAARKGYEVIGVDPSLGAVMAARRVCDQLGITARFVVADARFLPFRGGVFDNVFSYSVIQHFSRGDARITAQEVGRVLNAGGISVIQMPTKYGIRCFYHQFRRRFREARGFEVRYWRSTDLKKLFEDTIGATNFSVDCFFGIGVQKSDIALMPRRMRYVIRFSELAKAAGRWIPMIERFADSVFVTSKKAMQSPVGLEAQPG